jgi:hypothetical protein
VETTNSVKEEEGKEWLTRDEMKTLKYWNKSL